MNRASVVLVPGAAVAVAFSVSRSAHAMDPIDVEVAIIAGGGTTPTTGGNAQYVGGLADTREPNPLGFGLGVRAGDLRLPVGLGGPAPSSRSYDTLCLQPGITVLVPFGAFFAGADANVLWLQNLPEAVNGSSGNHSYLAPTFHAQVGARF